MKEFVHLNLYERQRIEKYLKVKKSLRFIARKLDRSVSSISDETKQNSVNGKYSAEKADFKAYQKRWRSKTQCMKVNMDPDLKKFVINSMEKDHQSPEGISGRLRHVEKDFQYASTKAIYKFVKSSNGRQVERYLYSKAVHKKSGRKRDTPITIDGRTMIDERPKKVENRLEFGHYEGDFIESGKDGKGSLLVLVERKTRYPFLLYLEDRSNRNVNRLIEEILHGLPVKSFTVDNDISFQKHEELSELIEAAVFFCHPQSPHEKGTVENRNKAIRRYVKKKTDLSSYPKEFISEVERKLRDRFMECLRFKTPREAFARELQKQNKPRVRGMMKKKLLV
ncbi:MAG TPA: IS30 family transposase [Candidatus Paceibacterota bacterium]